MKRIFNSSTCALVLALLISACRGGGGGGGTSPGDIVYTGVTTQAPLTTANANEIFSLVWNGGTFSGSVSLSPTASKAAGRAYSNGTGIVPLTKHLAGRLSRNPTGFKVRTKTMRSVVPVDETIPGAVSGTLTMTGSIDETTLTGSVVMTFSNFNDGGYTIDGVVTMIVDGFDRASGTITDATMSFTSWTMKSSGSDFTLGGSIRMQESLQAGSETLTINMVGRDNIGNDSFRFENYVETTVYDNLLYPTSASETYSGRVYAAKYGYVDVSTVSPCIYMNPNSDPGSGGPLILAGAGNTKAAITPISSSYVKIEVDNDGDGVYEDINVYAWSNLEGTPVAVIVVANAGPDQTVSAGSLVTLDGSGSTGLNGGGLTFSWTLTVKPAGSGAALSNPSTSTPTFTADTAGAYVISLVVSDGTASSSDTVVITAMSASSQPAPRGVAAVAGDGQVTISWNRSTDPILGYNIYWKTTPGVTKATGTKIPVGVALTSYTHTGLTNGMTYYYVVTFVFMDGTESSEAPEVSATPVFEGIVIEMSVSPATITFPVQRPLVDSAPVTVTVTNLNTVNLVLASITFQGTNSADFKVADVNCLTSGPIAPSGSCTFNVIFNGAAAGAAARTATVIVTAAIPSSTPTARVSLTGIIDSGSPTVILTFPADGQTVPVNTVIMAVFSEPMAASTVNEATFIVTGSGGPVTGSVMFDDVNKMATFTPDAILASNQPFTATITTGVTDIAGNPLAADEIWSFIAVPPDTTPPTIVAASPANNAIGVPTGSPITVTFSEPMLPASITSGVIRVASGGAPVNGAVTVNGNVATFTPTQPLTFGTVYTVTITTGALDLASNPLAAAQVINFVTNFAPSVPVLVSPADGASGLLSTVTLTWTKATDDDGDTLSYQVFLCINQFFIGCNAVVGATTQSSVAAPSNELSFTATGLNPGTLYFWRVQVLDPNGGSAFSETRSFRTQ